MTCCTAEQFVFLRYSNILVLFFFFFFISLTVGASRRIEAQMELPRPLFGVDFQIFIVTPQMFRFSRIC